MTKRLLIVEDEPSLLQAIAVCLRSAGYEVTTARNGKEALTSVLMQMPDLIVSDVRMPVMDGYTLTRQLRSVSQTSLIPIILLTSHTETADRVAGFRAGVDSYLAKPFEPEELLAAVLNIFNRIERNRAELLKLVGSSNGQKIEPGYDESLTETENHIAEAISRGLSNKEIAQEFKISPRTVENHISSILDKKNFSNRVEIARWVIKSGMNSRQ